MQPSAELTQLMVVLFSIEDRAKLYYIGGGKSGGTRPTPASDGGSSDGSSDSGSSSGSGTGSDTGSGTGGDSGTGSGSGSSDDGGIVL